MGVKKELISVSEAEEMILGQAALCPVESLPLTKAYGRVLRESVNCDRDQPALNKSLMDGIAIAVKDYDGGQRSFSILGTIPAGQRPPSAKKSKNGCFKIMTGAGVPNGFDAVVPVEYLHWEKNEAVVHGLESIRAGWNIRDRGANFPKWKVLLNSGEVLSPTHVASAASVGKATLKVSRLPKVAIISTGDELVAITQKAIKPYQTRMSNAHAVEALLQTRLLARTELFHIKDEPEILYKRLKKILSAFDVLILSGGVSKGDFDFVPKALERLKVSPLFHQVAQKPGKPLWFGKSAQGQVVFGLPGNPVSTLVCAYRYVVPFLSKSLGMAAPKESVRLSGDMDPSSLTRFVPVNFSTDDKGERFAVPVVTGGSGDFGALSQTVGFVELHAGKEKILKNSLVPFYRW